MSNTIRPRLAGLVIGLLAVSLVIVILAPTVGAATGIINITVTKIVFGSEGDLIELATEDVPDGLVGQTCAVKAVSENQHSVHPNNDIHVNSGESSVLLADVEAVPSGTVEGAGQLVLDSTIVVLLELGPDGVFSAGIDIVIDCTPTPTEPRVTEPRVTEPPPPLIDTAFGCDLAAFVFVVSASNVGSVDVLVGIGWDSGNTSDDLKSGEVLTVVIPAGENWTIFEKNVPVEQGTAESCDEVSPTSITATTTPEVSPETLPFTGAETSNSAAWALVLVAGGALALVWARVFQVGRHE